MQCVAEEETFGKDIVRQGEEQGNDQFWQLGGIQSRADSNVAHAQPASNVSGFSSGSRESGFPRSSLRRCLGAAQSEG